MSLSSFSVCFEFSRHRNRQSTSRLHQKSCVDWNHTKTSIIRKFEESFCTAGHLNFHRC